MTKQRVLFFAIALLTISVALYQHFVGPSVPAHDNAINEAPLRNATSLRPVTDGISTSVKEETGQLAERSADPLNCLTIEQLDSHPILAEDSYRFDSVATSGSTIASYRGLSSTELLGLATQGDSAAMAVLGAMSVMRARKQPQSKAVAYLMHEDPGLWTVQFSRPLDSSTTAHLEEAREWFYQAALHGRVMALYHVGDSLWRQKGGPVELGWIDSAEYDSLSSFQKNALLPSNVYNVLAFEIAPELQSGPHGNLMNELMPRSERQQQVLDALLKDFHEDLETAELPPISVAASTAPSIEELMSLLCQTESNQPVDSESE